MPKRDTTGAITTDLAQAIERQIFQRTWGRIHRLEVKVIEDRVVVRGFTQSYHAKQLALQGVLDVLGPHAMPQMDIEVEVTRGVPNDSSGQPSRPDHAVNHSS